MTITLRDVADDPAHDGISYPNGLQADDIAVGFSGIDGASLDAQLAHAWGRIEELNEEITDLDHQFVLALDSQHFPGGIEDFTSESVGLQSAEWLREELDFWVDTAERLENSAAQQRTRAERSIKGKAPAFAPKSVTAEPDMNSKCSICFDVVSNRPASTVWRPSCNHPVCTDCLRAYVDSRRSVLPLPCPFAGCTSPGLTTTTIELAATSGVLPRDFVDTVQRKTRDDAAVRSGSSLRCPCADCDAVIDRSSAPIAALRAFSSRGVQCRGCGGRVCLPCGAVFHEGLTCEEFSRRHSDEVEPGASALKTLAKARLWQRCPTCRLVVELAEGCKHIVCMYPCATEFCYEFVF
ncbi:hypothetical protein HK101_001760 [Irineochytrium annulatum]|nr:hypothetical protein HK101_001760 [Irineochytrium annulatum]